MKLLFACGGSGGHIFPAVSVVEELKERYPAAEILYVCGKKDIESAIFKVVKGERIIPIESAPFRGSLSLLSPYFLIKSIKGFFQSMSILKREKPDLVAGFGGYASFAPLLAARLFRVRTIVHEQNVVPGITNRLLGKIADGVALSFPDSTHYLNTHAVLRVTGNPIRRSIEKSGRSEALTFFGFSAEKTTVLVLGGSQGAQSINHVFLEMLKLLPDPARQSVQVLHLCGKMPPEGSETLGRTLGITIKAHSFFERMDLAYGAADLAIGRAGATFLAEIGAKKIPAVLIPYPYGNGHQRVNAKAFAKDHEVAVVEQEELDAFRLKELFLRYLAIIEKKRQGAAGIAGSRENGKTIGSREQLADFIEEILLKTSRMR